MAIKIGVIAEDISDVHVITEILAKYIDRTKFSVKHFVGQGCGKLKTKCQAWATSLTKAGCQHILIFHDLDRNNEASLRKDITERIQQAEAIKTLIVIPVEELEAWLLSDIEAIRQVFSIAQKIKAISDSETVKSPKEHLQKMVRKHSNKIYMNTVHNKKIATHTNLQNLIKCSSYKPLDDYMKENFPRALPI